MLALTIGREAAAGRRGAVSKAGNSKRTAEGAGGAATDGPALPALTAVAAQWADRPPEETLHTAALAADLGYPELWIGEESTYDAFALATAIGLATERIRLTIGPLSLTVRDPAMIAMGAASVTALTRHPVTIAVSAPGAEPEPGAADDPYASLAAILAGEPAGDGCEAGATPRLPPPGGGITAAALEPAGVRAAAKIADRVVLDLVNIATAARVRGELDKAAGELSRDAPRLTVRLPAAVGPSPEALAQLVRGLVPYLGRPGHHEMFAEAGFGEVADLAHGGAGYQEVVRALPLDIIGTVGLVGTRAEVTERLAEYAASGVDEIAVIPATAGDRGGATTLTALHDVHP